jgi:GcrA cell cycle regulator
MSAHPGPWDKPGMIDRLRELHARGDSFTEIADALGVSKNSVIGKVHRLDLPPRPLPAALEGVKNKPRAPYTRLRATGVGVFQVAPVAHHNLAEASAQPGPRAAAATAHLPFLPVVNSAAGASKPRPQLFPVRGCQFPMWGDKERLLGEEPRFCDAPARRNEEGRQDSAYCPAHHARCFSKRGVAEDEVRQKPKNRAWQGPPARGRFPGYV